MSEKTEVDQAYDEDEDTGQVPGRLPEHQYSREELIEISKSYASAKRPKCLDQAYDSEDGRWDPDRWYKAKFGLSREVSPLTLGDGKDRRRAADHDKDVKRRPSLNDPVERLKEERDGIILSPQRRSFGTGCHVQSTLLYTRQLNIPDRDRDDPRADRDRDRERERDRDRERPVRKIGSGRIQIDRENSRDYSSLRDRFDERDTRERDQDRERDYNWSRDRDRERDWDRDSQDRDARDTEWDRDRRFDRSDRFRRAPEREFSDRDRRDRDFRDRGFERNGRRRNNYRLDEKEPEWFTGGPTSQMDTIELRGFEREGDRNSEESRNRKSSQSNENGKESCSSEGKSTKESSEEASEVDVKISQCSSPEEDQQILSNDLDHQEQPDLSTHGPPKGTQHSMVPQQGPNVYSGHMPLEGPQQEMAPQQGPNIYPSHVPAEASHHGMAPQQGSNVSPSNKLFDFDEILKASILPLDGDTACQGSRFSRFFTGPSGAIISSDVSSLEDMLMPRDLLDDSHVSPAGPSPTSMMGPMGALSSAQLVQVQRGIHPYHDLQSHVLPMPNSAGDNNAAGNKSSLPLSVTALFNSAAAGNSAPPVSANMFNTQDAEAQLKAMLFRGHRDSASSSGTASPASLPPGVQHKVKTVAELEADMHQSSPQKHSPLPVSSAASSHHNPSNSSEGDMTAYNKLLIMINAASEASQNATQTDPQMSQAQFGMVPTHSEFNHAVMRNKEEQIQLMRQSLQNVQQSVHLQSELSHELPPPAFQPHHQVPPPLLMHQQVPNVAGFQQKQQQVQQQLGLNQHKQIAGMSIKPPGTPVLRPNVPPSHQNAAVRPRAQSGGPMNSSDPILSFIQNPTIVMNPASPAPYMAAILTSQQSAVPSTARVPSPLMFSQQPPLHLSAPSPIHPAQLSPRPLAMGPSLAANAITSPTGMRSPVLPRVVSPSLQEIAANAQAVMQSALIKKQLQDQSERFIKKQQERAKSPGQLQMNVGKTQPANQHMIQSNAQTKPTAMNTFTPTSVLRKMHSDKALEKERQVMEGRTEDNREFMPSVNEMSRVHPELIDSRTLDSITGKSEKRPMDDLSDISFLDPVNPNLVAVTSQLENLRLGQTNILPGSLSQPMSVEEKMKLSALAEVPGYLSQMLDKSAKAAAAAAVEASKANLGRPIVKAQELSPDDRNMKQQFFTLQQSQHPPPMMNQSLRPMTGPSPTIQPSFMAPPSVQTILTQQQLSNLQQQQQQAANKPGGGRAIVGGGNSIQQQPQIPGVVPPQNIDVLRMLDIQRMQQMPSQGMALPPPPIACLGPPPVAVSVPTRIPVVSGPVHPATNAALMHQQIVRANTMSAQHNHQLSHLMALQQAQQQQRKMGPVPAMHAVMPGVSAPLSPRLGQTAGPLSPAAISATIQRVASPHGTMKMNGPTPPAPTANGGAGPKVDLSSGIQRWFSPDILKTQLPSMPPLPTKGNQVMTVDELEGN